MLSLEETKKQVKEHLESLGYVDTVSETIVKVVRPGVVLVKNKNVGLMEMWI